jgi:hypothetical protein
VLRVALSSNQSITTSIIGNQLTHCTHVCVDKIDSISHLLIFFRLCILLILFSFFATEFQFHFFNRRTNMSSVIFQPLLHDPLGWKSSNSTYADTFTWKKYRKTNKDKKFSAYGQQYQKQLQKQQTNNSLPPTANDEQTIQRVILVKKNEENRGPTPASCRYSPSKTPTAVIEEPPVLIVDYKQRPASTNRVSLFILHIIINKVTMFFQEATCGSRASQRSPTAPPAVEGKKDSFMYSVEI